MTNPVLQRFGSLQAYEVSLFNESAWRTETVLRTFNEEYANRTFYQLLNEGRTARILRYEISFDSDREEWPPIDRSVVFAERSVEKICAAYEAGYCQGMLGVKPVNPFNDRREKEAYSLGYSAGIGKLEGNYG